MYNDHKKIIRYTTLLILNLVVQTLYSKQDISFNQYMFGHQILNPAYSGSKNISNITSLSRSQWTGFDGAPISQSIFLTLQLEIKT